jgi:hypothetical protein
MEAGGIEPAKKMPAIVLVAARLDVGPEQAVSPDQVSFDSQLSKLWVMPGIDSSLPPRGTASAIASRAIGEAF